MPTGDVETYFEAERWHNRVQGSSAPTSSHDTKAEAVDRGRDLARELGVEHIIKNQDGTISERNSYGNDPRDIPG